jgi:hypothetical protein
LNIRKLISIAIGLLLAALAFSSGQRDGKLENAPLAQTSPFSLGERLVYTIKWDPPWYLFFLPAMEAGEADLQLVGPSDYKNKKALKISLKGRSSGALTKLAGMKIEDTFVFYAEPETFCTLAMSSRISEGKRKRQIDVEYLRETHQLHFREMDEAVVPPKLKKDVFKDGIPSCVHDPFSALYFYRQSQLSIDHVQKLIIGDNDKIKEIQTRVEKKEVLETVIGKVPAWRIQTVALMGGLFKEGGQFMIWLSADERKLPLQFEVKVRLGRVLGKLKRVEP